MRARDWPRGHGSVGNLAILAPKARPRLQTAPITEPALASLVPFPSSAPICHLLVRALRARPVRLAHCALMPTPTTHHYHHYHHHLLGLINSPKRRPVPPPNATMPAR